VSTTQTQERKMTGPRYTVATYGRNHYVSGDFIGLGFSSKRKAQAKADEKNAESSR
jgi:hypothetical protein